MNYIDAPLTQMGCDEFVSRFEPMHSVQWPEVRARVNRMLGDTMRAASGHMADAGGPLFGRCRFA